MPALLPTWEIAAPDAPPIYVSAANWLIALGEALQHLGGLDGLSRLACEKLRDGTVLVHDFWSGQRYTVRPAAMPEEARPRPAYAAPLHA